MKNRKIQKYEHKIVIQKKLDHNEEIVFKNYGYLGPIFIILVFIELFRHYNKNTSIFVFAIISIIITIGVIIHKSQRKLIFTPNFVSWGISPKTRKKNTHYFINIHHVSFICMKSHGMQSGCIHYVKFIDNNKTIKKFISNYGLLSIRDLEIENIKQVFHHYLKLKHRQQVSHHSINLQWD